MNLKKLAIVLLATTPLVTNCGAFKTKSKGEKARQTNMHLAGTWTTDCTKLDWLGLTSERETLKFSALGDFDRTSTLYTDGTCGSAGVELTVRGTFDTLGPDSKLAGSDDINFTVVAAAATPRSDLGTAALNVDNYCDNSTWSTDATVDILDRDCAGSWRKGSVVFDVYRLENDNKNLRFGRHSFFQDKTDAASRPTALDDEHALVRK
jgi:hypothetical protein